MPTDFWSLMPVFFQIAVLTVLLALSVPLLRDSGRSLMTVFLTFSFALLLFTDLYWAIYDLMRPDVRMPFAANEIGEAASFLLWAAVVSALTPQEFALRFAKKQAIGALVFAACNVALWIGWSGEWMQDILIGAAYGFFLYTVVCALTACAVLRRVDWICLLAACSLLVIFQGLTFFVSEEIKTALDVGSSALMVLGLLFFGCKLLAVGRRSTDPKTALCLIFALLAWEVTSRYMSEDGLYSVLHVTETLLLPLIFFYTRKAVRKG